MYCEPITDETSLEPGHRRQPYLSGACDAAELATVPPQPLGSSTPRPGNCRPVLSGELDFLAVPVLSGRLMPILAAKPRHLVFDMARVTFATVHRLG